MPNLLRDGHTPYGPADRKGGIVRGGKAKRPYPTQSEMFLKTGATIFVALCYRPGGPGGTRTPNQTVMSGRL